MHDAQDPQFYRNLASLGPVQPQHAIDAHAGRAGPMMGIMDARARIEMDEASDGSPGLTASELVRLLEEYKAEPHRLDQLATEYAVDRAKLHRLVRFVSVPDDA